MTLATQITDGPKWLLIDKDLHTVLGVLFPIGTRDLYLVKNDCGSGSVTIPITSPYIAHLATEELATGKFIGLEYRGSYRGGFLIENWEAVDASNKEYSGLAVTISGRTEMALVDDAIVPDWWTPDTQDIRKFGTAAINGTGPVSMGSMLYTLLCEARDKQTLPWAPTVTLERYCWHWPPIESGDIMLDWDFTDALDSNGNAWSDAEDLEFRVMTSIFEILKQFSAAQYDFTITRNPATGLFTLHGYDSHVWVDKTASLFFRVGVNCLSASRKSVGSDIRNYGLIEFPDPVNPFDEVNDVTSQYAYRRRETGFQTSNSTTRATALIYGAAELARVKDPKLDFAVKLSDAKLPRAFVDYNLGDIASYSNGMSSATVPYPITGIHLTWPDEKKYATVVVERQKPS